MSPLFLALIERLICEMHKMTGKIRVGIVGASGYAGGELLRLFASHPRAEVVRIAGESKAGATIGSVFPHLRHSLTLEKISEKPFWTDVDAVFFALPAGQSFELVRRYREQGVPVFDLGPDYRLKTPGLYRQVYGMEHGDPLGLEEAVYGLPEWAGDRLTSSPIVACPGCFPTGALMGLLPFFREELVVEDSTVVDGKSGISGAGRGLSLETHFPEIGEGMAPYKLLDHRHVPEMEQCLAPFGGGEVTFVPHLVPMSRGILSTLYMTLRDSRSQEAMEAVVDRCYEGSPFVRRIPSPPNPLHVRGTNDVLLHVRTRGRRLVVVTAIDNLVRGAGGQGIQSMNRRFGLPETLGISAPALFP